MMNEQRSADATFVVPCLNEAAVLDSFLRHCRATFTADESANWRILVADNGSTDGSPAIVASLGVGLLQVPQRGYGAAVNAGILAAGTDWVIYADADSSYQPEDAVRMLRYAREQQPDLLIGSRLRGTIHPGAMPVSHRLLGTPVLSFLLRRLYGVPVTDCNSGIRCVRRRSYQGWKVRSRGMEFASALLIRAASEGARIEEIPVDLRPTPGKRVSHLRTWTDGMRHLLVILAASPILFWRGGVLLTLLSLLLAVPCVRGPRLVFHTYGIWGEHTLVIALIIGFYGTLAMNTALSIYSHSAFQKAPKSMLFLLRVREGVLFWWLVATMAVTCAGCFYVFLKWRHNDYGNINYITTILFFLYACVVHSTLLFGIFQAHLGLRSRS